MQINISKRGALVTALSVVALVFLVGATSIQPTQLYKSDLLAASAVSAAEVFQPMTVGGTDYAVSTGMGGVQNCVAWWFHNEDAVGGDTIYINLGGVTSTAVDLNRIVIAPGETATLDVYTTTVFSYIATGNVNLRFRALCNQ